MNTVSHKKLIFRIQVKKGEKSPHEIEMYIISFSNSGVWNTFQTVFIY